MSEIFSMTINVYVKALLLRGKLEDQLKKKKKPSY